MVDVNDITGFIMSCKNADYLRCLHHAISERLNQIMPLTEVQKLLASRKPPEKKQEK